jgi:hypothetical protein
MITSEAGLRLSLDQLRETYLALAAVRAEHPNASPAWLAILSEGLVDHARQIQREVEEYTGTSLLGGQVEDHVGDLREIDLDDLTLAVRNAGDVREVRCTFEESLLEAAKGALDRRVKVSGVRQRRPGRGTVPTLHVFHLEVLDDAGAEKEPQREGSTPAAR